MKKMYHDYNYQTELLKQMTHPSLSQETPLNLGIFLVELLDNIFLLTQDELYEVLADLDSLQELLGLISQKYEYEPLEGSEVIHTAIKNSFEVFSDSINGIRDKLCSGVELIPGDFEDLRTELLAAAELFAAAETIISMRKKDFDGLEDE